MKNKTVLKNYQLKIKKLNYHNKLYFEKSNPAISDSDYDKLKKEILELEKNYKFLNHNKFPSKKVGFKPSKLFEKY